MYFSFSFSKICIILAGSVNIIFLLVGSCVILGCYLWISVYICGLGGI